MINPKWYLFIYGFVFWCISGLKGKNYQYFGSSFNLFKTTNPWIIIKDPFTPHRESLGPSFKSPGENPASSNLIFCWNVIPKSPPICYQWSAYDITREYVRILVAPPPPHNPRYMWSAYDIAREYVRIFFDEHVFVLFFLFRIGLSIQLICINIYSHAEHQQYYNVLSVLLSTIFRKWWPWFPRFIVVTQRLNGFGFVIWEQPTATIDLNNRYYLSEISKSYRLLG